MAEVTLHSLEAFSIKRTNAGRFAEPRMPKATTRKVASWRVLQRHWRLLTGESASFAAKKSPNASFFFQPRLECPRESISHIAQQLVDSILLFLGPRWTQKKTWQKHSCNDLHSRSDVFSREKSNFFFENLHLSYVTRSAMPQSVQLVRFVSERKAARMHHAILTVTVHNFQEGSTAPWRDSHAPSWRTQNPRRSLHKTATFPQPRHRKGITLERLDRWFQNFISDLKGKNKGCG